MSTAINVRSAFVGFLVLGLAYLSFLILRPFASFLLAGALLAFMLHPLHLRLSPYVGQRPSAFSLVAFSVVATLGPLAIVGYLILDSLDAFAGNVDDVVLIDRFEAILEAYTGVEVDLLSGLEMFLQRIIEAAPGELANLLASTVHFMLGALLLVFVLYYLILDGSRLVDWLVEVTPLDDHIQRELFVEANVITWAVLKSHLFVAIIEGVLTGIGLYIAGVPNAAFWTAVMILLAILPIVGVSAVWAPAVAYLVYLGDYPEAAFLFVYGGIAINLDGYFRAILVEIDSDLHPAVVLVGVLGGLYVFGVLGLFIGPIVLAIFKATVNVYSQREVIDAPIA
ncbi:MAG: AI-2E family transporter [Halobacteriales archaeon]